MSRQMKQFADYFMQGMALGSGWSEKWMANQVAKERNRLISERQAAQEKRENIRLGLYGQDVQNRGILSRARAEAALRPKGGGKTDPTANPGLDALTARWTARDTAAGRSGALPAAPTKPQQINITTGGSSDGGDDGGAGVNDSSVGGRSESYVGDEYNKGGVVKKYYPGGMVGGEDQPRQREWVPDRTQEDVDRAREESRAAPKIGGGQKSGKSAREMFEQQGRRDYSVPSYEDGGMTLAQAESYAPVAGSSPKAKKPAAGAGIGGALTSALGKYKGEGETKSETGAVTPRGPQGSGAGGSYTTADVGAGGVLATDFKRGGTVRRFQSGGRVMEAIDTGTSGPGSGFGYRAAPPARSY